MLAADASEVRFVPPEAGVSAGKESQGMQQANRQLEPPEPEEEQFEEERRYLVTVPVARYFALLVGITMTPLGLLGFIPWLTPGGALFGLIRVTPWANTIHVLSGLAGLAVWKVRGGRYARTFALVVAGVYLITFSTGNIGFGNLEGSAAVRGPDIPWIVENALHASLMLAGALVAGLAALQQGDKATKIEHDQRRGKFHPSQDQLQHRDAPPASA